MAPRAPTTNTMAKNTMRAKRCPAGIQPGFNDSHWQKVDLMDSPGGRLRAQMLEPTRITQVLKPVSIHQTKPGIYIVDFGQNFYGQVRLRASAPAGTVVKMQEAYSLNPDGSLRYPRQSQRAGDGHLHLQRRGRGNLESALPRPGIPPRGSDRPARESHRRRVFRSRGGERPRHVGSFECSIPLLNQTLSQRAGGASASFCATAFHLDPDRDERQPWLGDPAKDSEGEAFNFNVAAFYDKWIQ